MDKQEVEQLIDEKLRELRFPSIHQQDLSSDSVKQRHVGEGVRYIRAGTAANRPTSGEKAGAVYFATNTDVLSVWNGTTWVSETLT